MQAVLLPASLHASRRNAVARMVWAEFAVAIVADDLSCMWSETMGCEWLATNEFFGLRCESVVFATVNVGGGGGIVHVPG